MRHFHKLSTSSNHWCPLHCLVGLPSLACVYRNTDSSAAWRTSCHNMYSTFYQLPKIRSSQCVSHAATFFITPRAETSIAAKITRKVTYLRIPIAGRHPFAPNTAIARYVVRSSISRADVGGHEWRKCE